jgi:hypothetical protein
MKKFLLLLGVLALPMAMFGQGTVSFANTSQTLLTTNTPTGSGNVATGYKIRVGLYIAPDGTTDPNAFTLIATATNSGVSAGRFTYPVSPYPVPGNTGQPIAFQVRAWTLTSGLSYEEAVASNTGLGGVSALGRVTPATGTQTVPALFATNPATPDYAGQLTSGFALVPIVPEPSSIALGLLGLGAIALFRRRK